MFIIITLCTGNILAQDGHYWSHHYGTTSNLLNGIVIGSVNDLGVVYYNPGRLATLDNPSFLLSTRVYQLETLTFKDALGENKDLQDRNFGGVPELLAASFDIPSLPSHRFAISLLARRQSEFDILTRSQVTIDDASFATGEVAINTDVKEEWFGLTWAHKVSSKVSFGLSNFLVVRSKSDIFNIRFQALDNSGDVVLFSRYRDFDMGNIGFLWKGGVSLDYSPVTIGLVITTPRINISGSGSYLYEDFFTGLDTNGDGELNKIYASNFQDNIDAEFRSPWAIGLGAGIRLGKATIHLSAEWYDKVTKYTLLDPEPFIRQSDSILIDVKVIDDFKDVLNYGVGLDLQLKDNLSVYASVASDYTAAKSNAIGFLETEDVTNNAATNINFIHFSGGGSFIVKKIELIMGLGYAYGNQSIPRPVNLPDGDDDPIFDESATSTLRLNRWKFIFGFSIPFLNKAKRE
jgi:long-subunit fatty acid transport protein